MHSRGLASGFRNEPKRSGRGCERPCRRELRNQNTAAPLTCRIMNSFRNEFPRTIHRHAPPIDVVRPVEPATRGAGSEPGTWVKRRTPHRTSIEPADLNCAIRPACTAAERFWGPRLGRAVALPEPPCQRQVAAADLRVAGEPFAASSVDVEAPAAAEAVLGEGGAGLLRELHAGLDVAIEGVPGRASPGSVHEEQPRAAVLDEAVVAQSHMRTDRGHD